jgi:protein-histidine pros-kinase
MQWQIESNGMIDFDNSDKLLRALWEFAPDALVLVDRNGGILMGNNSAEKLFGYNRGELPGRPLETLMPERYRAAHVGHRNRYFANSTPRPMGTALELLALRKDGSEFPVSISLSPIKNGEEVFALSAVRDITESKRNAQRIADGLARLHALREIETALLGTLDLNSLLTLLLEKIENIFPSSAGGVRLTDAKTGEYSHIVTRNLDLHEVNKALAKSGKSYSDMVIERRARVLLENIQSHPIPELTHFLCRQGVVSYLGLPLVARDETVGVLSIFTKGEYCFNDEDLEFFTALSAQAAVAIRNSQLYEQQQNLAASLQRSLNAKEEFLGFISHELKTPFNALVGYLALMQDKFFGEINWEQQAALKKMRGFSEDLLAMINNLLLAGKIDFGGIEVNLQEIQLGNFLDELSAAYDIPARQEVSLNWDYSSTLSNIISDREKLRHVLQNLINNAIKYTVRGDVTVAVRVIEGDMEKAEVSRQGANRQVRTADSPLPTAHRRLQTDKKKWVEFKVVDTGIGIPKEDLPLIFDRFRQVDSVSARRSGGVGLGLDIAKRFTELLGGTIGVESELEKGSVFTVTLPIDYQMAHQSQSTEK